MIVQLKLPLAPVLHEPALKEIDAGVVPANVIAWLATNPVPVAVNVAGSA